MSDESPHSPSVSVSLTSVLSSAYHLNSMIYTSSSLLPFKTSFISTFNWSLHLLWDVMDCHPHVSVEEHNSPADQIKDTWHISNESQLQSYTQQEPWWFLQMLNNLQWEWDTDVQHAQELHNHLNEAHEQNNVTKANLWVLQEMSTEASTKSTTQKHSAPVKDPELFNGNYSKWKWFKQAVNNKLCHNTNHYPNHNDKIDYIDSYLGDKVGCVLNHK